MPTLGRLTQQVSKDRHIVLKRRSMNRAALLHFWSFMALRHYRIGPIGHEPIGEPACSKIDVIPKEERLRNLAGTVALMPRSLSQLTRRHGIACGGSVGITARPILEGNRGLQLAPDRYVVSRPSSPPELHTAQTLNPSIPTNESESRKWQFMDRSRQQRRRGISKL